MGNSVKLNPSIYGVYAVVNICNYVTLLNVSCTNTYSTMKLTILKRELYTKDSFQTFYRETLNYYT